MARFWADVNGVILQFLPRWQDEQTQDVGPPNPNVPAKPANANYQVSFDEASNPQVVAAWQQQPQTLSAPGGTLTQTTTVNGQQVSQPVVINDPSLVYLLYRNAASIAQKTAAGVGLTPQEVGYLAGGVFRALGIALPG